MHYQGTDAYYSQRMRTWVSLVAGAGKSKEAVKLAVFRKCKSVVMDKGLGRRKALGRMLMSPPGLVLQAQTLSSGAGFHILSTSSTISFKLDAWQEGCCFHFSFTSSWPWVIICPAYGNLIMAATA